MPERREKPQCRMSQQRCHEAEPQSKTSNRLTLPLERTAAANRGLLMPSITCPPAALLLRAPPPAAAVSTTL